MKKNNHKKKNKLHPLLPDMYNKGLRTRNNSVGTSFQKQKLFNFNC